MFYWKTIWKIKTGKFETGKARLDPYLLWPLWSLVWTRKLSKQAPGENAWSIEVGQIYKIRTLPAAVTLNHDLEPSLPSEFVRQRYEAQWCLQNTVQCKHMSSVESTHSAGRELSEFSVYSVAHFLKNKSERSVNAQWTQNARRVCSERTLRGSRVNAQGTQHARWICSERTLRGRCVDAQWTHSARRPCSERTLRGRRAKIEQAQQAITRLMLSGGKQNDDRTRIERRLDENQTQPQPGYALGWLMASFGRSRHAPLLDD